MRACVGCTASLFVLHVCDEERLLDIVSWYQVMLSALFGARTKLTTCAFVRRQSTRPQIFGSYSVFKDTGVMQVKPIPPKFKSTSMSAPGTMLALSKQVCPPRSGAASSCLAAVVCTAASRVWTCCYGTGCRRSALPNCLLSQLTVADVTPRLAPGLHFV